MTSKILRLTAFASAPVFVLALGACSSSGSSSASESSSASPASGCASPGATTTPPPLTTDNVTVSGPLNVAPTVAITAGTEPPKQLVMQDVQAGCGTEAGAGATLTVNYDGVLYSNSTTFDSSWKNGKPASFPLDGVIPCWQSGVVGMKAGGRRLLICPPDTAYGAAGQPPVIPANSTLVFVVDLVSVDSATPPQQ